METWSQIVYIADCVWLLKISVFHQICQQKHGIAMIHLQNVLFSGSLSLWVKKVKNAVSGLSFYLPSVNV